MTVPKSGVITSSQIAGVTRGYLGDQIDLDSAGSRQVAGRPSGDVSFENFRGRGWVQGNVDSLPTNKDPRPFGYYSEESYITGSGNQWELYLFQNEFYSGEYKGVMDCNSFFYCSSPGVRHTFTGTVWIDPDYASVQRDRHGAVYVWGYSNGYLAGSRVSLGSFKSEMNRGGITMWFTPTASHPYVVINAVAWGDGANSVVQGQQNGIRVTITGASITT